MKLTKKQIIAKLLKPIGKRVAFKYPGGKADKRGLLKDRAIVQGSHNLSGADYWDVVDLIEFPQEKHPRWIRIGYYRQVGSRLRWASQTTITEPVHIMKRLLAQAAQQKKWFRAVLSEAAGKAGGPPPGALRKRNRRGKSR